MEIGSQWILEVSGPESGLEICVNGFNIRRQTPSEIQVKTGDLVYVDGLWNGAWLVSGREKFIRFKMSKFLNGMKLFADVGEGDVLLGYRFDPSITQHRFNELVMNTRPLRVIYFIAPPKGSTKSINSVSVLLGRSDLWALSLFGTLVSDITPLANLTECRMLNLKWTLVSDIEPLRYLKKLKWLSLWGTKVKDLTPLVGLSELLMLNLRKTLVSDLSPLANMPNLMGLNLWGTPVTDISPLEKLQNLRWLYLQETKIPPSEIAKLIPKLPNCHIES